MKYIKLFEDNDTELKKYAVISFPKFINVLMIIEIVDIDYHPHGAYSLPIVNYKKLYTWRDYYDVLRPTSPSLKDEIHVKKLSDLKNQIEYQSDNLEECIDNLHRILDVRKFNM